MGLSDLIRPDKDILNILIKYILTCWKRHGQNNTVLLKVFESDSDSLQNPSYAICLCITHTIVLYCVLFIICKKAIIPAMKI